MITGVQKRELNLEVNLWHWTHSIRERLHRGVITER